MPINSKFNPPPRPKGAAQPDDHTPPAPRTTVRKDKSGAGAERQRRLVDSSGNAVQYERSSASGAFGRFHPASRDGQPRGLKQFRLPVAAIFKQPRPGKLHLHPTELADVEREAHLMAEIGMRVHGVHVTPEGKAFIETDLFDGSLETIHATLPDDLRVGVARHVMKSLCHQLAPLHARGSVHRDIKGGNILFKRDGTVQLADPGFLATADQIRGGRLGTAGSPAYMGPEHFNALQNATSPHAAADVWSMGCFYLDQLVGQWPLRLVPLEELPKAHKEFAQVRRAILNGEPIPKSKYHWDAYLEVALECDWEGTLFTLEYLLNPNPRGRDSAATIARLLPHLPHNGAALSTDDALNAARQAFTATVP